MRIVGLFWGVGIRQAGMNAGRTPKGTLPEGTFFKLEAAASSAAGETTAVSLYHGARLIDGQAAASHFGAIQCIDGFVRSGLIDHLNKAEALRATRIAIRNDAHGLDSAEPRKRIRD